MTSDLRRGKRFLAALTTGAALLLLGASAGSAAAAPAACTHTPIIFVHGIEGSGGQFESQKMRFMSNGYEASCFDEVDYNSTRAVGDKSEVNGQIDAAIAGLQASTGSAQVDLVAHSLGTSVMHDYLTVGSSAAERRADVAHYINVDGQSDNPGVPTLAVWAGRGTPGRHMDGAENVTIPNQTHVQTCTSAESFVEYYRFLTGSPPAADITPQNGPIQIAGKALDFPVNLGLAGATIEIWGVNDLGQRTGASPSASVPITDGSEGGGAWGPVTVETGRRYEFAIVRDAKPTLHVYYEPFVRSDYTLRLLASDALQTHAGVRPGAASAVFLRYKEIWGDQGAESDRLTINGLVVCTPGLCPASKQVNALFAFDVNRNGQTDLSQDPVIGALPFLQGVDVFVPGSNPADDTISFQLLSRGVGPVRALNTPNWEAVDDGIVIQWNDFESSQGGAGGAGSAPAGVRRRAKKARAKCKKRRRGKRKAAHSTKKKKKKCPKKRGKRK